MTHVKHHDLATGLTEIVITAKTREMAQQLLDFLNDQDKGTNDVYYLAEEDE